MAEKFKLEETSAGTKWWDQAINRNNKKVEAVINTIIDNDSTSGVANAELALKVNDIENNVSYVGNKVNVIETSVNNTYDRANLFLTNYKGICIRSWITGSLNTARFRDDFLVLANKMMLNSVALTINTYQPNVNSNEPFKRCPIELDEIESYINFLKNNNFRILFKSHVEIDSSEYKWRALIEPTDVDIWFENYTVGLVEYAKVCEKYKVEAFSVGTEYIYLSKNYPEKWIEVIKEIRNVYSGLLTYGANLNNDTRDEVNNITFWDYLDFVGIDFYVYPTTNATTLDAYNKAFYHSSNHYNTSLLLDSISSKTNKPIVLTEYGYSGNDASKNLYLQSLKETVFTKEYINGGFIWVYDPTESNWVETNVGTIDIVRSINNFDNVENRSGYYTTMKNGTGKVQYSKFLEYETDTLYKDAYIKFNFYIKGVTSVISQHRSIVEIKITTHDTKIPKIFFQSDGNISANNFLYRVNGTIVEFYVLVPNYYSVIYKPESSEIGLFNIHEYSHLIDLNADTFTPSVDKIMLENTSTATKIALGNVIMKSGTISGTISNGFFNSNLVLSNVSTVFAIVPSIITVDKGDILDIVCNGTYVGGNTFTFRGKHTTISDSDVTYTLSYIIIYK